ncbi:hypothetical protein ACFY72_35080 [Streptomyces globisporus]
MTAMPVIQDPAASGSLQRAEEARRDAEAAQARVAEIREQLTNGNS